MLDFILGKYTEALLILAFIFAVATTGFAQEFRSERALEKLRELAAPKAVVVRNGVEVEIPAREIVPGDVIVLATGSRVPADGRLIEAVNLKTDEACLTGESVPVTKRTGHLPKDVPVSDRANMVFSGTIVVYGRGKAVVTSTGMRTEFGKIAGMVQAVKREVTPLERRIGYLGRFIVAMCVSACAIITAFGIIVRGYDPLDMLVWGVSLAVAAVPASLPAIVIGTLAVGVLKMARRNAIVRRLPAVEVLGCTTVICADKTGTMTKGEMAAREVWLVRDERVDVAGVGYELRGEFKKAGKRIDPTKDPDLPILLEAGVLCNDASIHEGKPVGDPTEAALVVLAAKAGMAKGELEKAKKRVGEVPFTSERKRMTTIHEAGELVAYMKGATEVVLDRCGTKQVEGRIEPLRDGDRQQILKVNDDMASRGLRVLAIAYRKLPPEIELAEESVEQGLTFVGLVGMLDAPREEVLESVKLCKKAGIRPVMITGDHKLTAMAIAREIGVLKRDSMVLTGEELDRMSNEELERIVEKVDVYARVSPAHKVRIVEALKKRGEIASMTGDGINDAPALKFSDIGVAMGIKGTDVAKEASSMVLTDDNFATIVSAVREGRRIYDNVKKYLVFLLSCNISEVAVVVLACILGYPLPLTAAQILWVNLVTDGPPAMALGVDPEAPDIMERQPRDPKENPLVALRWFLLGKSAMITAGVFAIFTWYYQWYGGYLAKAQTAAFTALVMFEMFNAFNCRSERHSLFELGPLSNKALVLGVAVAILAQIAVVSSPIMREWFGLAPLTLFDWLLITALASTIFIAVEIGKLAYKRLGR